MEKEKSNLILGISLALVFLITIGISYAYFAARIVGSESTSTIALSSGSISIHYTDNTNTISLTGIYPREKEWAEKTFNLYVINTTNLTNATNYKIGLDIEENDYKSGGLMYSLENTLNEGGTVQEKITGTIYKSTGIQILGSGSFNEYTNKNHTYLLKIYFIDTTKDQNIDQKAKFKAKVIIEEGVEETGDIAIYEDGVSKENMPETSNYWSNIVCKDENDNIVDTGGTLIWDGEKWVANPRGSEGLTCEATFDTTASIIK